MILYMILILVFQSEEDCAEFMKLIKWSLLRYDNNSLG